MLRRPQDIDSSSQEQQLLRSLVDQFIVTITERAFPCFYAPTAVLRQEIWYDRVEAGPQAAVDVLAALRELCTIIGRQPDAIAVIFVDQPGQPAIDDDFRLAQDIVHAVLAADHADGGRGPSRDPGEPAWILWLDEVGLFINFSSPRHRARRSRSVGPQFCLIAQARDSFDRFGRSSPLNRRKIRQRLSTYDSVPPHPCLGSYGDPDNLEALQFFLGDGTEPMDVTAPHPTTT